MPPAPCPARLPPHARPSPAPGSPARPPTGGNICALPSDPRLPRPANWWEYARPPVRSPPPSSYLPDPLPARQLVRTRPPFRSPSPSHLPDPPPTRQLVDSGLPSRSPFPPFSRSPARPSTGGNMPALQIPVSHFPRPPVNWWAQLCLPNRRLPLPTFQTPRPPVNWLAEMVLPDPRRPAVPCPRFFLTMGNVRGDTPIISRSYVRLSLSRGHMFADASSPPICTRPTRQLAN